MKISKHLVFLVMTGAAFCSTVFSWAQGGYLKAGGGYAIGINRTPINSYFQREVLVFFGDVLSEKSMVNISTDGNATNIEIIKGSFGKGGTFGISGGYMFSKHFGAELGLSYFMGQAVKSTWSFPNASNVLTEERKAKVFFINPSLVVTAGKEGISPYARIGALIGVASKLKSTVGLDFNPDIFTIEDELSGGTSIGLSAAFGVNYSLSPKISVYAELAYSGLSYSPTERVIKRVTQNGVEQPITNLYTLENQLIKDVLPDTYSSQAFDATDQLTHAYPFGNLGLNLGVQFNFQKE